MGLILLALGLSVVAWTPEGRAAYNTAVFITQVVPDLPAVTAFQPESTRERLQIDTPEGPRQADLYRPVRDGSYAAVVLFLGVAPAGPDDPRVVNLGHALARSGLVTLVYWSPDKFDERLHPPDVHNLVAAHQYLQGLPLVDPERVGFGGFCVGASFSLMAAAQPEVRDQVAFVNAFGPYHDVRTFLYAYGVRERQTGGDTEPWRIDPLTERVTTQMLLSTLPSDEQDRVEHALITDTSLPDDASAEGRAVYRILAGGTSEQVEEAMASLPTVAHELFDQVSPSRYLADVEATILLMHDRADDLVPAWESRQIYDQVRDTADVRYTEFGIFDHMDPTRDLPLTELVPELWKLASHLYTIMRQAA